MPGEKSGSVGRDIASRSEDEPSGYSTAPPILSLSQMGLHNDRGFEKRVSESFKIANAKGFLIKCTRCEGRVTSTTYHYGCPKCTTIAPFICQKCRDKIPKCRIHQTDLAQRTLKSWPAAPPWVDYVSTTPTKQDNPLICALKTYDNSRTTIYASDSSLLNARIYLGYTPLHVAAHLGLVAGASILLSHGALTNIRDHKNNTPLITAIELDQPHIVQLLIENGANIHSVVGFHESTALHSAAANGFPTLISVLLEKGAMVDNPSERGTPLQLACGIGSVDCVSILLEKGANPNYRSEGPSGEPAIVSAVRHNFPEVVDLLFKFGADLDLLAKDEEVTALSVAVSSGLQGMEKKLLAYGADPKTRSKQGARGFLKVPSPGS